MPMMEPISWLVQLLLMHICTAAVLRNGAQNEFSQFEGEYTSPLLKTYTR